MVVVSYEVDKPKLTVYLNSTAEQGQKLNVVRIVYKLHNLCVENNILRRYNLAQNICHPKL